VSLTTGQIGALSGLIPAAWHGAPDGVVQVARSSVAASLRMNVCFLKSESIRSSRLPFWFATRMYEPSPDGNAACACRPVGDCDARRHSSGLRAAASNTTTWPLATKASVACVCSRLNSSMCGRTGAAPVLSRHSADVSAARSTIAAGFADPGVRAPTSDPV
jgi:hypothetical protein